ncbi:LacI family transcriptional regulator [Enterococcus sp. DIV2402]|uniref:LacI family transcriptional regulator n=1 Tax=Candidatus Enterococcus lowellii TaxID=2230877 RepID=A0ABZ2SPJ5_9ENTE|nr:LacI family DNA-binding transcriptional regulator [Enterococcus sp. DIV2402]MBO0463773.1 LacI family DNA-binding transcriptional regulator [Enterococcus sp. DIV2402]
MPTMNDVAKLAGVSRGTVSNYVNGVKVKESSQKKIQSAIEQLNYIPNIMARELKMNRSNLVVFIIPSTRTPFFAELTHKMQQALREENFKMLLCNSNNEIKEELEYIQMAKEQKVAGIITISYSDLAPYIMTELPIVSIEKRLSETIPCISADNYSGGKLAAQKLVEKGSKNLLVITRSTYKTEVNYGQRVTGVIDYCEQEGVSYTLFDSRTHEEEFYPELADYIGGLARKGFPYDGIFAVADQYADFCLNILESAKYEIPKDIQIIGFDGGRMYPEQQRFVSSIRQPISEIVQQSVHSLQLILQNKEKKVYQTQYLPVDYLEGITTRRM